MLEIDQQRLVYYIWNYECLGKQNK